MKNSSIPKNEARRGILRAAAFAVAACAMLLSARPAAADLQACTTAHAAGQRESKAGHLRQASQLYTKCGSDEACPEEIKRECTELLQSTRQAVPTVIFSVVDTGNRDVSNVKVYSTDDLIVDSLDGRAVDIDPGKHHLRFVLPWGEVLSSDVLVREGEKNRVVRVETGKGADAKDGAATAPTPEAAPVKRTYVPAWIATGIGVAALATGVTTAIMGDSKKGTLDDCKPNCPTEQRGVYDNAKTLFLVSDIAFGATIVSAAVATWLFVAPPKVESSTKVGAAPPPQRPRLLSVGAAPTLGGAQVGVAGEF